MIKNRHILDEFHRKLDAEENLSYHEALAIYEMLHKEAVSLGAINSENIQNGLEVDIRIARAINKVTIDFKYVERWLLEFAKIPECEGVLTRFKTCLESIPSYHNWPTILPLCKPVIIETACCLDSV